jgi:release factor glutamine methyltransferase
MASLPDEAHADDIARFNDYLTQRCGGKPVSYIRGRKEFYGREFVVSPAVLVPRPETELLVEVALDLADTLASQTGAMPHVHDVCTGTACIPITLAAERPELIVSGSEIDEAALVVAERNRDRLLGAGSPHGYDRLPLWRSDLLQALPAECAARTMSAPSIITANPPYLTDTEYQKMKLAGWPEPELALRGGSDGLDLVRRLADEAVTVMPPGGYLVVEIGPDQGATGVEILHTRGFSRTSVHKDLAGRDRVIVGRSARRERGGTIGDRGGGEE